MADDIKNEGRLTDVEKAIITLNRELGEVAGQLRILKWLMGGTLLTVLADFLRSLIT